VHCAYLLCTCARFPADVCDPVQKAYFTNRSNERKEHQDCSQRRPIQIGQFDASGQQVKNSRAFVKAQLINIGTVQGADLTSKFSDKSCCKSSYCTGQISVGACCNCSNPECALCAFPESGIVTFPYFSINKLGNYRIEFYSVEFNFPGNQTIGAKESIKYVEPASSTIFTVAAGQAANLEVQVEPTVVELRFAKHPVPLNVLPTVKFTDKLGNEGVDTGTGTLMAQLCSEEPIRNAPYICSCSNRSCLEFHKDFAQSRTFSEKSLRGDVTTQFNNSVATFTDLQVLYSSSTLRFVFQWFQMDSSSSIVLSYQNIYERTNVFDVRPGALDHISLVQQPSRISGCERCPVGIHLAGSSLKAVVEMLDVFDNRIVRCESGSEWCKGVPNAIIVAHLFDNSTWTGEIEMGKAIDLIPGNEGGQLSSTAKNGLAGFDHLKVRKFGSYVLVFKVDISTRTDQGKPVEFHVYVASDAFHVVNGAPSKFVKYQRPEILRGADMEMFRDQPQFELVDNVGNRVVSDCYTVCSGTLASKCTATSSNCSTNLYASLFESSGRLHGQRITQFVRGIALFSNLAVENLLPPLCTSTDLPATNYTLQLRAAALDSRDCSSLSTRCVNQSVKIQERVQRLRIAMPPTKVLAYETFSNPIEIRVLGCSGLLTNVNARVKASINDNSADGTLLGQTSVLIQNGTAFFTDLAINAPGSGYTLMFRFIGRNQNVQPVISQPFPVQEGAEKMEFESGTDLGNTKTRAGVPFAQQPKVRILNKFDQLIDSSAQVTARIKKNPAEYQKHDPDAFESARLRGTVVTSPALGIAAFTDLYITKANVAQDVSGRFTLEFLSGQMTVESPEFDILPVAKTSDLVVFKQPTSGVAGTSLDQFVVFLVDEYKNRIDPGDLLATGVKQIVNVGLFGGTQGATLMRNNPDTAVQVPFSDPPRNTECLVCTGAKPTTCTNFKPVKECWSNERDGFAGLVKYEDLRIDKVGNGYYLRFFLENSTISTDSTIFRIVNNIPVYPQIMSEYSLPKKNRADMPFAVQPRVLAFDFLGNPVVVDSLQDRTLSVRLVTQGGLDPVAPPLPQVLPPGQEDRTICSIYHENLAGTTRVLVDSNSGQGIFTDLVVRQVMKNYQLEFTMTSSRGDLNARSPKFEVTPGITKGICNMSLPDGFSELSPHLQGAILACVDEYGNVQTTCETCFDKYCGMSPMTIGSDFSVDCPSQVCVKLYRGPRGLCRPFAPDGEDCGAKLLSLKLGSTDCSRRFCGVDLGGRVDSPAGFVYFTDLQVSEVGSGYQLKFYTNVGFKKSNEIVEWSYITPPFDVLPAAPRIERVQFTPTMAQIEIAFNKETNMNGYGVSGQSIDCSSDLDDSFLSTLGKTPTCIWTSNKILEVSLGEGATVTPETQVHLSTQSQIKFILGDQGRIVTSLPATTTEGIIVGGIVTPKYFPALPAQQPHPVAKLVGPSVLGACDKIQADSGLSSGFAGRLFGSVKWNIDLSKSQLLNGLLESPGMVTTFQERRIHFSSAILGDLNTITITLRPVAKLPPGTNITITGLPTDDGFFQPCKTYNVPIVSKPCHATGGFCKMTPILGPGKDIFTMVDFGGDIGRVPAAQSKDDIMFFTIRKGYFLDDAANTVFRVRTRNPLDPRKREDLSLSAKCDKCFCLDQTCTERGSMIIDPQAMRINCKRVCPDIKGFIDFPDQTVKVISGSVSESSTAAGTSNIITLMIQTNLALGAGSEIHVWGLERFDIQAPKCAFGEAAVAVSCATCTKGSSNIVSRDTDARLVFIVRNGSAVNHESGTFKVALRLKNPDTAGPGVQLKANVRYSRSSPYNVFIFRESATSLSGTVLTGKTPPSFQSFDVRESNTIRGAKNWITMSFSSNVQMPFSTSISVAGLHVDASIGTQIPLYSKDDLHLCFESEGKNGFAKWYGVNTSLLVFEVSRGCEIRAFSVVTISFQLRNPATNFNSYLPSITASHRGCIQCNEAFCTCAPDDVHNFSLPAIRNQRSVMGATLDPSFKSLRITDNNKVPGEKNTLFVALTPGIDLLNGTIVKVTGLGGTLTESSEVVVRYDDDFSSGAAPFDPVAGVLTIQLDRQQVYRQDREFVIQFDLRNPKTKPALKTFGLSTKAIVKVCGSAVSSACPFDGVDSEDRIEFPLQNITGTAFTLGDYPKLKKAHIRESTRVFGALNLLLVGLQLNVQIKEGTRLILSGLVNSQTFDVTDGLTSVSNMVHLYPNCSCDARQNEACGMSDNCAGGCESCTMETEVMLAAQFRVWQPQMLFGDAAYSGTYPTGKTVSGTWIRSSGTLTLTLGTGKSIPANTMLEFAFVLTNAQSTVPPSKPKVSIYSTDSVVSIIEVDLDNGVLGAAIPPKFDIAELTETTLVDGGFSQIKITLEPNCPLVSPRTPGTRILVYGLTVFEDASQYLPLNGEDIYDVAKSGIAYWDKEAGRLILTGSSLIGGCNSFNSSGMKGWSSKCALDVHTGLVKKQISFSLSLKKEPFKVVDASMVEFAVEGMVSFSRKQKASAVLTSPLDLPQVKFLESTIQEASRGFGSLNPLTVNLKLNTDLTVSSKLTITGLVDTLTVDANLTLRGHDAELFSARGTWTQGSGTLVVRAEKIVDAGKQISFIFEVTNARTLRAFNDAPVRPRISGSLSTPSSSLGITIDSITMTLFAEEILTPSEQPSFDVRVISASNQVKNAVSTITISLRANVAFMLGSEITVSGLHSKTKRGELQLFGANADDFEAALWEPRTESILIFRVKNKIDTNSLFVLSFLMQNPDDSKTYSPNVRATGGPLLNELVIETQKMTGITLSGEARVSWMIKAARETTKVANQINAVTFSIMPTAPLYEGTKLTLTGLAGLQTKMCLACTGKFDLVPGLGCATTCDKCPSDKTCLPIFKELPSLVNGTMEQSVNSLFETSLGGGDGLGIWDPQAGTLILTIAKGRALFATQETTFTLMLRNSISRKLKAECGSINTREQIASGTCMTLKASIVKLCQEGGILGTDCDDIPDTNITPDDISVDQYNKLLFDTCPVCVRNEDLVSVENALAPISDYTIADLPVFPPSLKGQPTLISGGAAAGSYVMVLTLSNWIGKSALDTYTFEKESGLDGPLGNEKFQPFLYVPGDDSRELFVHSELSLIATARAALCQDDYPVEYLRYSWEMYKCIGTCSSDRTCASTISSFASFASNNSRALYIPPNTLPAGQSFQAKITAIQQRNGQSDLKISSQLCIDTLIRPVVPVISGAGTFVSVDTDLKLSAGDSFDPEFATTKASIDNFDYIWTCKRIKPPSGRKDCVIDEKATFSGCPDEYFVQECPAGVSWHSHSFTLPKQTLLSDIASGGEFGGFLYRIRVQVYRNLTSLPSEISNNPRFQDASQETSRRSAIITFGVRKSSFQPIKVTRCDSARLGFRDLCTKPDVAKRVSNRQKIVLHVGHPTISDYRFGGSEKIEWTTTSELGSYFLAPQNLLTSVNSQVLILKPGTVLPGQRVWFRATITAAQMTGFAEVEVNVNVPPVGGIILPKTTHGDAFITDFTIGTYGWTSDTESLPFNYRFMVHNKGVPSTQFPISVGKVNSFTDKLPPGDIFKDNRLQIDVQVIDAWGSEALASSDLFVALPTFDNQVQLLNNQMMPYLQGIRAYQDHILLPSTVNMVSGTLNLLAEACQLFNESKSILFNHSDCLSAEKIRQEMRQELLGDLVNISISAPLSSTALHMQATLLRLIIDRPEDVSHKSAVKGLEIVSTIRKKAMALDEDISDVINVLGYVSSRLLGGTYQALILALSSTSNQCHVHPPAPKTTSMIFPLCLALICLPLCSDFLGCAVIKMRQTPMDSARAQDRQLTRMILNELGGLSALSIKNAESGTTPPQSETFSNDAWTMTTWRYDHS
jgi:hypothetical protein